LSILVLETCVEWVVAKIGKGIKMPCDEKKAITQEEKEAMFIKKYGHSQYKRYLFPVMYGSTAGPFGGIGGSAMTNFTMEAFFDDRTEKALIFCNDQFIKEVKDFTIGVRWS